MSEIKIKKANKIAGLLPMARLEVWDSISSYLIDRLTAKELAEVQLCLNKHWHKALYKAEQNIVDEGYVWSKKHNALLDIKIPTEDD